MHHLRRWITAHVVVLAIFFLVERLSLAGSRDLASIALVYFLIPGLVLATVGSQSVRRVPASFSALLWIGVYLIGRQFVIPPIPRPLSSIISLSLAELVTVGLVALTAHSLGDALDDFKQSVEQATLARAGSQIPSVDSLRAALQIEINRSRRYHRPLSTVAFRWIPARGPAQAPSAIEEVQRAMADRFVQASLGGILEGSARRIDIVARDRDLLFVFCPGTDAAGSKEFAQRIQTKAAQELQVQVTFGVGAMEQGLGSMDEMVHQAKWSLSTAEGGTGRLDAFETESAASSFKGSE